MKKYYIISLLLFINNMAVYADSQSNFSLSDLASLNQDRALAAIEYYRDQKSPNVVVKGLQNTNPKVQIASIEALKSLGDKTVLAEVINSLEINNYVEDGSETATIHQIIKIKLIALISSLSGNKYCVDNPNDTVKIKELIAEMRRTLRS